ncbi:MAG: hypothetical protein JSS57_07660 [Proteobacteria bacterium]|nr:hypothetical protein [Pseudomonadota bacterium]
MTTSMREALEPFAKITHGIEGNDNDVWHRHDGDVLTVGDFRRARAALSSPAPDRLSEEERRAVENLRTHQEQCDMDGVMVKVSRQAVDETLAIIDRLSRQPSRTEELTANISEQAQRVGATFVPSAEKIETYEAARAARQPEAEPVGYLYFCTDCESRLSKLENGRCGCGSGRVIDAPHTSPRLDREKVADTWECAGRKQAYPEPGECDWPGCGCDPNATKVIESFLEQNWKPPLDRKAIMAALKPFAAISVYEDDDSAPVKVIVNYRISYDFTLGDFRALQSADAIMRETR